MPQPEVLLIDASSPSRYALRLGLQAQGARVRQAQSVEQALRLLQSRPADLVITASILPGLNALDLLELLSASQAPPPVLVHCGNGDWPLAEAARRRGARAVLTSDALRQALPTLLRSIDTAPSRLQAETAAPACEVPSAAPVRTTATTPLPERLWLAVRGDGFGRCWPPVLAAALLGLLAGYAIAAVLAPDIMH
jgi:DNA-binding NtrC family response regulator